MHNPECSDTQQSLKHLYTWPAILFKFSVKMFVVEKLFMSVWQEMVM